MGPLGVKSIVNKLSWVAALATPAAAGNYRLASQLPHMGSAPTWAPWATSQPLHYHCPPWRLSLRLGPGPIHSPTEGQGRASPPAVPLNSLVSSFISPWGLGTVHSWRAMS